MERERISAMLKDGTGKHEAEINRLVSGLAETLTPLIADHIEQNGLPGTMRVRQEFGILNIVKSDDDYEPTGVLKPHILRFSLASRRIFRTTSTMFAAAIRQVSNARNPADEKVCYLSLNTNNRTFLYRRKKENNEHIELTVPVDQILERLALLYRKSGCILDIAVVVPPASSKARHELQYPAFNIELRPIQVSDKPNQKVIDWAIKKTATKKKRLVNEKLAFLQVPQRGA